MPSRLEYFTSWGQSSVLHVPWLAAMTVFLYPIFRKDSEELALEMLIFREAIERTWYFITTLSILVLFALGNEYY